MSDYGQRLRRDRRRDILQFLADSPSYTSNSEILFGVVNDRAIGTSRDQVVTELAWLAEQGFVALQDHDGFVVATATERGLDLAGDLVRHPEVSRPRPRPRG